MKYTWPLALLIASGVFISCDNDDDQPDDPIIPNEEEVITTLTYTLVDPSNNDTVIFSFRDLDGDGGDEPVLTEGVLQQQTTYNGSITLLNELEDPVENITEEVEEEDDEHQLFYSTDISNLLFQYADFDEDDNPLGLLTTVATDAPGSGTMTIILRHEPNKNAPGVNTGDITNAGGETDIEVTFNVEVQ